MSFSAALLSNHQPVLLHWDFSSPDTKTLICPHDELHEVSLNPFFQPDKVLLKSIPTPFSVIHKLAEDALLSIVQVANDNMEQYESQY